ncbi:MAG: hypothetical protein JXB50_04500 [Spirochaetes bacterium]|nr:hypothetical protein [Spirochaetota bacterium]
MKFTREKIIKILIASLIIQIILIILLQFFSYQNIKARTIGKKLIKDFNVNAVVSLEFSTADETFTINKKEGFWLVKMSGKDIPAELIKIDSFLDIIRNLPEGVLRDKGSDPANDVLFGLDKEHYKKITIKSLKKKDIVLYIGDPGVLRGTSYIRINNERKIREIRSVISNETEDKPVYWVRKRIFEDSLISAIDVDKYIIESSLPWIKESYSIEFKEEKDEAGNIINDNFILNPPLKEKMIDNQLLFIINGLINLTAFDYKLDNDLNNLVKLAKVRLILKNGTIYNLTVFSGDKAEPEAYIVSVDFNNYLYYVKESDLKKFAVTRNDMIDR